MSGMGGRLRTFLPAALGFSQFRWNFPLWFYDFFAIFFNFGVSIMSGMGGLARTQSLESCQEWEDG